jgi:DNA polymerase elongation subunit (family B)
VEREEMKKAVGATEVVFDIETRPRDDLAEYQEIFEADKLEAWRNACAEIVKQRKAGVKGLKKPSRPKLKSDAPGLSPLTGQICSLSAIVLEEEPVEYVKAGKRDEAIMDWFYDFCKDVEPTRFISYNGISFDIPFIIFTAAKYEVKLEKIVPDINDKYGPRHVDLFETASRSSFMMSLKEMSHYFGYHHFLFGAGREVEGWVANGEWKKVEEHNLGDARATVGCYHHLGGFIKK